MALINNTIRLHAEFRSFTGSLADPDNLTINVYDEDKRLINTIPLGPGDRKSAGIYEKDYTIPAGRGDLKIVFSGVLENTPVTGQYFVSREE